MPKPKLQRVLNKKDLLPMRIVPGRRAFDERILDIIKGTRRDLYDAALRHPIEAGEARRAIRTVSNLVRRGKVSASRLSLALQRGKGRAGGVASSRDLGVHRLKNLPAYLRQAARHNNP